MLTTFRPDSIEFSYFLIHQRSNRAQAVNTFCGLNERLWCCLQNYTPLKEVWSEIGRLVASLVCFCRKLFFNQRGFTHLRPDVTPRQMSANGAWHHDPRLCSCFLHAKHFWTAQRMSVNVTFLSNTAQRCNRCQSICQRWRVIPSLNDDSVNPGEVLVNGVFNRSQT